MSRAIQINGRFLTARQSGVQRVAGELLRALDDALSEDTGRFQWELLVPKGAPLQGLNKISVREVGPGKGVAWEQLALPWGARGATLVNFANMAPLAHRQSVTMMHDAQIFDTPQSYSSAFVAWYRFAQPRLGRIAKQVLTVSAFSKSRLLRHGVVGPGADAMKVIPNGVDHILRVQPDASVLERAGLAGKRFALGFLSSQAHKNTELLFRLFDAPRDDGLHLVLVGHSPSCNANEANITVLGSVTDGELKALYQSAVVLLVPSLTEGFGLPAGEAMLCGCPAITADAGALPEFYGDTELSLPARDVNAWSSMISRLADDEHFRHQAAGRCEDVASRYSWRTSAGKLRSIVEAIHAEAIGMTEATRSDQQSAELAVDMAL